MTRRQDNMNRQELSIKTIKEDIAKALLEDVRIINAFQNSRIEKTKNYIGGNIFGYLDDNNEMHTRTDSYIYFDVTEGRKPDDYYSDECYDVSIQIKVHKDLLGNEIVNILDNISFYVEDIIKELYPYHSDYSNKTEGITSMFAKRNIHFVLTQASADMYVMDINSMNENK